MRRQANLRRVPAKDRIRVSRACRACRLRKSRCVPRSRLTCQRCEANGRVCVFEENDKSQDPVPERNTYARPSNSPSQASVSNETVEQPSRSNNDSEIMVLDCSTNERGRDSPEELVLANQQRGSLRLPSHETGFPDSELEGAILLVEDPGRTQYTGIRSNESFLRCVRDVLEANSGKATSGINLSTIDKTGDPKPSQVYQSNEVREALQEFPPQEIGLFLVSTFFYYVEATFFYCDRDWFYKTLASVYSGSSPVNAADDAFVCLTLLIFAFGSQFAHLRCKTKSQEPLPSIEDPGKRFYDVSQKLMPRLIAKCTLKGIQVCLLAGLYNLPSNLPDTAYLYLGMAMRMSVASGLHRKTLEESLDPRLREVRNRLWWSVYCIDKRTSIVLGRPASIAEEDIDASYPVYHRSLDELDYQSNVQHQVEYIKLTRIVNQIMQNIPLESKPSIISDLSRQLKRWRSELFSNLHPNDLLPSERNFRTTVHLHIHYHWAWIRMGRASLLQLSRERLLVLSGSLPSETSESHSRLELARLCIDAAKATIQLILVLKKHNLLCRFSYTDHQAPTAALIILVLNSILQHSVDTSSIIDDGVDMLRFMARGGCRGAKSDLQTIEQFKAFAFALRQKIYQGEASAQSKVPLQPTSTTTTLDSYQSWVKWMSDRDGRNAGPSSSEPLQTDPVTEFPQGSTNLLSSQQTELLAAGLDNTSLDMLYSHDHFAVDHPIRSLTLGNEDFTAFNSETFEWENRSEMLDITQLLTKYTQNFEHN